MPGSRVSKEVMVLFYVAPAKNLPYLVQRRVSKTY